MDTKLFSRRQQGGMFTIVDRGEHVSGTVYWVDSSNSAASDSAGYGQNPDAPFATLDYAISACTANVGDTVMVMPGHSESWTTTGAKVVADVAGVRVIGLGTGTKRPTFSFGHTGTTWTVSAANVTFENLLFVTAADSVVTFATVSGTDCKFINCEFRDTTDVEVITDLTVTGDRFHFINCFKNGYTSGNANVRVVSLNGVDDALIQGCRFRTKVTTAVVGFVSAACSNVVVKDCVFEVNGTTNYSKTVVDTITGSTWAVVNCFDLGAGASFSGGSGGALAGDDVSAVATAVTTNSTGISAAASQIASVGIADSTYSSTTQSAVGSVGIAASTFASTGESTSQSVGIAASTFASTGESTTQSVGVQASTVQSKTDSVGVQASTVGSATDSVGIQTSTVQSKTDSVAVFASTLLSTNVSMLDSLALIISTINSKT